MMPGALILALYSAIAVVEMIKLRQKQEHSKKVQIDFSVEM